MILIWFWIVIVTCFHDFVIRVVHILQDKVVYNRSGYSDNLSLTKKRVFGTVTQGLTCALNEEESANR